MRPPQGSSPRIDHAARERDASADLAESYRAAYPRLVAIAAGVLGRAEGAEDVVQTAAQITLAKGKRFDSGRAMVKWLAGVVRHCALNRRRQTIGRRTHPVDPSTLGDEIGESDPAASPVHPHTGALVSDQSAFDDRVQSALAQLTDDARCCLLLRVVHQLSYAEIGELIGMPEGTAMSHVHRSKQRLREILNDPTRRAPAPARDGGAT